MLKFSGTLRNSTVRISPLSSWRIPGQPLLAACSGTANLNPMRVQEKEDVQTPPIEKLIRPTKKIVTSINPMVQAAFESLKQIDPVLQKGNDSFVPEEKIIGDVDALLNILNEQKVLPTTALAVITLLLDWVNKGKAELSDFEMDPRFLILCKIWLRSQNLKPSELKQTIKGNINAPFNEYNIFYESTGVDDILKVDPSITVNQMIQVMKALAFQKRRSPPLLRSLCLNIHRSSQPIGIKQMSDILYSMATLNYPDEALLEKISNGLIPYVKSVDHSAIIRSILTSLSLIRYHNQDLLDELSEWTVTHVNHMRSVDICALFRTLATIGYTPTNIENLKEVVIKPWNERDVAGSSDWLTFVWSLTVLGLSENRHISSVLNSDFVGKYNDRSKTSMIQRYKLLNINAAAKFLMKDYEGPLLESDSDIIKSTIMASKEKQEYARSVVEVLHKNFPAPEFLQTNVNFHIGILVDAEVCINTEGQRLPVKTEFNDSCRGSRIAMFFFTYNDFCRGKADVLGFHKLYRRMLEAKGYSVLHIPLNEFTAKDKISQRIEYIDGRIKSVVN